MKSRYVFLMRSLLQRWLKPEQPCWVMWIRNRCPVQNRTLSQSIDLGIFVKLLSAPFECARPWDTDHRYWKKQTLEWKDFSRPVGDILPSQFLSRPTFLLNSGAYWNYRAQNVDQLAISSQVARKIKVVIVSGWSRINSSDHQHTYYYDVQSR